MINRKLRVTANDLSLTEYCIDDVVRYIDSYLRLESVPDDPRALNGLQAANSGRIGRIAAAVDACQATIDEAAARNAGLLLVHHGLFWGGLETLTGRHGRRVRKLIESDIAVYAAHIPLDCHPEVGNNPVLARGLAIRDLVPFGEYQGCRIGVMGDLSAPREDLVGAVARLLQTAPRLLPTGPRQVKRVAVVTGAGASYIGEAREAGADTLITGEGPHHSYFEAEELGVNVIYAGHYATETVGVKALAGHLSGRFQLPWEFLDHPTGL
jgi:dinuclear metal center YbgI/SA1388 family protein